MASMVLKHSGEPALVHDQAITDELVEAVWTDSGLTRRDAAALLDTSVNKLTRRARGLDLPMRDQVDKRPYMVVVPDERVRAIWARDDLRRVEQAAAVGITVGALRERAIKLKLPMRVVRRDKRISAVQVREAWLDPQLTVQQAADKVGLTRTNLWRRAKALNLPPRKWGSRSAIASAEDRQLFAEMWEGHVVVVAIAEYFGLHKMTVSAYARRLDLTRRTRPSLLISIRTFRRRRQQERLRVEMAEEVRADTVAQTRYDRDDFDDLRAWAGAMPS